MLPRVGSTSRVCGQQASFKVAIGGHAVLDGANGLCHSSFAYTRACLKARRGAAARKGGIRLSTLRRNASEIES